jgi:hypothetical protein
MGGFMAGILGAPFIYYISLYSVKKYRTTLGARIEQTKFVKLIKASKLYNWYTAYEKTLS